MADLTIAMDTKYRKPRTHRWSKVRYDDADDGVDLEAEAVASSQHLRSRSSLQPRGSRTGRSTPAIAPYKKLLLRSIHGLPPSSSRSSSSPRKHLLVQTPASFAHLDPSPPADEHESSNGVVLVDANRIYAGPGVITLRSLLREYEQATKGRTADAYADSFMDVVQVWPRSRENLLFEVRRHLQRVIAFHGDALQLENIVRATGVIHGVEAKYSTVTVGCVAGPDDGCYMFTFEIENGELPTLRRRMPVYIAVKMFTKDPYRALQTHAAVLRHKDGNGEFIAPVNATREILMGRMLNLLVQAGASPHFPCVYEHVTINGARGVVSEMAHMTLREFLQKELAKVEHPATRTNLLHIMFVQVLQGLVAAEIHFGMRHMDLNTNNVMMTFVSDATYCYTVGGRTYAVPNYGMCWKIIDYTLSTSSVLFGSKTDNFNMVLSVPDAVRNPLSRLRGEYRRAHSYALLDFLHLLGDVRAVLHTAGFPGDAEEFAMCDGLEGMCVEAAKRREAGGSLYRMWQRTDPKTRTEAGLDTVEDLSQQAGVLAELFEGLSSSFLVAKPKSCYVVFDTTSSLFYGRQRLGGFERLFYNISDTGELQHK